jgi:uncharacterized oligopeptide transporter (OPT) family protein
MCSKWALSRYPDLPPSSGVVPLSHLFIAAYIFVVAVYLYGLSRMEEEAETPIKTLVAYVFSTYAVFIVVGAVGMFAAYLLEDLFLSGLPGLKARHFGVASVVILIWLLVRAYTNFVNKHF